MIMTSKNNIPHYTGETEIIRTALQGDIQAIRRLLGYLSSANQTLCEIMENAIHYSEEPQIWKHLLSCVAYHCWDELVNCKFLFNLPALERMDQSVFELFSQDETPEEKVLKEDVLNKALETSDPKLRMAAGYLLGLRGDLQAIPILAEIIESGSKEWKSRAVKVLAFLKDKDCIPPLIEALLTKEGKLHREAHRALRSLGSLAEAAWMELLDNPNSHIRWHAARGLGEVGVTDALDILAQGLLDENYAVRWATADVLAHLDTQAITATLRIISQCTLKEPARQAAYHALNRIDNPEIQERLKPLLDSLHGLAPSIKAPAIAQRLLLEWESYRSWEKEK